MKLKLLFGFAVSLFATVGAFAQNTLIYDQQSASSVYGNGGSYIEAQPFGQSFTPSLSSVGFVEFRFFKPPLSLPTMDTSATVEVNLWSNSIGGSLLGTTAPVFMQGSSPGFDFFVTNLLFTTSVTVTPGTTYYFQPVILSGGSKWGLYNGDYGYAGGTGIVWGGATSLDFWFREGIVVPEPSAFLILFGGGALFYIRGKRKK
jgi:hypothetical protein